MTGEKKNSGQFPRGSDHRCMSVLIEADLSSRINVKRGGKLISKSLSKPSSPPSISAPPRAVVDATKVKKDEVQRRKNSFHNMLRVSTKEKDGEHAVSLSNAPHTSRVPDCNAGPSIVQAATVPRNVVVEELVGALAAARSETSALRQELERVKQDAQASVEMSKHRATESQPQAKSHNAIHLQNPSESSDEIFNHNRELQYPPTSQEEDLVKQNLDLCYRLTELQNHVLAQAACQPTETIHSDSDWNALTLKLHETEKESQSRLQQLLSLKSSISSLTRTHSQVADSELAEAFSQLANRVREWVVSNYRRTKMNIFGLPLATTELLKSIKSDYEDIAGADKLALYQAIVSHTIMRIFNEPVVVGMPVTGMYGGVSEFSTKMQVAGIEFHSWKRATLRLFEKYHRGPALQEQKHKQIEALASGLARMLLSITSTPLTSAAHVTLIGILATAADLQRTLCLQQEQYLVYLPRTSGQGEYHFDGRTMEPVNDLEYIMGEGHTSSQEYRADIYLENIVFKARVYCNFG